jgi:hypothetical protein
VATGRSSLAPTLPYSAADRPVLPNCSVGVADPPSNSGGSQHRVRQTGGSSAQRKPSGQGEYQDHGTAANINVKSTSVLAVVCSADKKQASIYGQATINRSGSYFFKIDAGVSVQAASSC